MKRRRWMAMLRAIGLASVFGAGAAQAGGETMARAGAVLGAMKESVQAWRDAQYKRPPWGAQARVASAQKLAQALAAQRADLARLAPQVEAGSRFATDLGRFLERWPDETAIRQNLMDESWGERLATDLTGLSLQAPDQSPGWKTPFPLFRP